MDYDLLWCDLNADLRYAESEAGGLGAALAGLETHQRQCGFIQDDLQSVKRLVFQHPKNSALSFRAQLNPKRARRHGGATAFRQAPAFPAGGRARAHRGKPSGNYMYQLPNPHFGPTNFGRSVLLCIDADFGVQIRILQH